MGYREKESKKIPKEMKDKKLIKDFKAIEKVFNQCKPTLLKKLKEEQKRLYKAYMEYLKERGLEE